MKTNTTTPTGPTETANHTTETFLSERELAARWGFARSTLTTNRHTGRGCPWLDLDGGVRYQLSDVLAYEAAVKKRTETSS